MVGSDSAATRIAYFRSLLSYRSMLMTTLARMRALRSFHSDVTRAGKNVDCSESLSLEADISLALEDLRIVDNEVHRITQYEAHLLDEKQQQLVSRADPQTVLSFGLRETLLNVISFADTSTFWALAISHRDCANLLDRGVGWCHGRARRKHQTRVGLSGREAVAWEYVEARKSMPSFRMGRQVEAAAPARAVAGALSAAVARRFRASLLPTTTVVSPPSSACLSVPSQENEDMQQLRRLLRGLKEWDNARASLPRTATRSNSEKKRNRAKCIGMMNDGTSDAANTFDSFDESRPYSPATVGVPNSTSVEAGDTDDNDCWWKVRPVADRATPPTVLTAAVHLSEIRHAIDTHILHPLSSSMKAAISHAATGVSCYGTKDANDDVSIIAATHHEVWEKRKEGIRIRKRRALEEGNALRLLRRCLQGIDENRRNNSHHVHAAIVPFQVPPPLVSRLSKTREEVEYLDARDQVRAVIAAATWYRWGDRRRAERQTGRRKQRTMMVEAVRWQAETLDRQTGGHVQMRLVVGLWPKHLLTPNVETPFPLRARFGEYPEQGKKDILEATKEERDDENIDNHRVECEFDYEVDEATTTPPLRLCFESHIKCQDTPVMIIREFGATLSYGLWETNVPTALVKHLVEYDGVKEDIEEIGGHRQACEVRAAPNNHTNLPNSENLDNGTSEVARQRLTSDEFHRMGFGFAARTSAVGHDQQIDMGSFRRSRSAPARAVLYNTGSHGAPLGQAMGTMEVEWPHAVVTELSTALFGRPVNKALLARFLVCITNPGGEEDGGAMRVAFEDPCLFGNTDIHDAEFAKFRCIMSDRMF